MTTLTEDMDNYESAAREYHALRLRAEQADAEADEAYEELNSLEEGYRNSGTSWEELNTVFERVRKEVRGE